MSFDPSPHPDAMIPPQDAPFGSAASLEPPKKSNRKWWFLGCGGCLFFVLLVCGGGGAFLYFQLGKPFADLLAESTTLASESQAVQDALGTPVEIGQMQQSSSTNNNGDVVLEYSFDISGPEGDGVLYLEASFDSRTWEWSREALYIEVDGERINIDEDEFNIDIDAGDGE